jgi:hypothetical protein
VKAFVVTLGDDRDVFLELTDALAGKGVNLTAVAMVPGRPPRLGFTVDREPAAREALRQVRVKAVEYELIELRLPNTPGSLARAARELADAGNPILLLLTLRASRGRTTEVIAVADPEKGRLMLRGVTEDGLLD